MLECGGLGAESTTPPPSSFSGPEGPADTASAGSLASSSHNRALASSSVSCGGQGGGVRGAKLVGGQGGGVRGAKLVGGQGGGVKEVG